MSSSPPREERYDAIPRATTVTAPAPLAPDTVMATITPAERSTTFRLTAFALNLSPRSRLSQAPLMALSYPLLRCMSRPRSPALRLALMQWTRLCVERPTMRFVPIKGIFAQRQSCGARHERGWAKNPYLSLTGYR